MAIAAYALKKEELAPFATMPDNAALPLAALT